MCACVLHMQTGGEEGIGSSGTGSFIIYIYII